MTKIGGEGREGLVACDSTDEPRSGRPQEAPTKDGFTPGPWSTCRNGECSCMTVMCADYPVATVTCGEWGDSWPSLRLVRGEGHAPVAEAFIERSSYGEVYKATATANARLIAAAPDLLEALQLALTDAYDEPVPAWGSMARAAVAKALGKTP